MTLPIAPPSTNARSRGQQAPARRAAAGSSHTMMAMLTLDRETDEQPALPTRRCREKTEGGADIVHAA